MKGYLILQEDTQEQESTVCLSIAYQSTESHEVQLENMKVQNFKKTLRTSFFHVSFLSVFLKF